MSSRSEPFLKRDGRTRETILSVLYLTSRVKRFGRKNGLPLSGVGLWVKEA
jgi:hypothetical protein